MRITPEQNKILESFKCERLSSEVVNERLIQSFTSKRGSSLVSYFKKFGLSEDREGKTTYYVIKTKEDDILMFFSMKCGALFDPLLDENEVKQDFQRLLTLLQAIENTNSDSSESEENDKMFRVQSTHPGIELVHFCANDTIRKKWKAYNLGHSMGETLYWKFIAPKFFEVQNIVGCEYAFLFAADLSEDGSLVNYYDVALKFQKRQDVGTNKPFYDFCCEFMCQGVNEMKKRREAFFENFNADVDDVIV